jgi:hypothetical protein
VTPLLRAFFGARGQLAVGVLSFLVGVGAWLYGSTLSGEALLRFLFHVSMYFGLAACYSIIAAALGYRATERVEATVVEHADEVDIG